MSDLISRHDAINALYTEDVQTVKDCRNCKHGKYNDYWDTWFCYNNCECSNWDLWESAEVIQRGEWVNVGVLTVRCSNCKSEFHELEEMNFCPNCGADMRGEDK